jgi:mono/diheme cytochrome c family protein
MYRWAILSGFFAAICAAQSGPEATFRKLCGTCHPVERVGAGRTRAQWQETIDKMVLLGAKGTDEEFAAVLGYLASERGSVPAAGAGRGRGGGLAAGPDDKHVVDDAAADRGRKIWAAECIDCHGTYARGGDNGPNLVRSEMVLRDRYGDKIGPFLRKGHARQSGAPAASFTPVQIAELSHFIHQRVYDTLRGSPIFVPHNLVTGDAKAGAAYFNGAGKCNTCHSPTGDLAHVASKYDPLALQSRFLSPRPFAGRGGRGGPAPAAAAKPVTLTVTPRSGPAVTGTPVVFDDFDVVIRDAAGEIHSWKRTADLKVVKNDPYAAHDELLEKYTDKNMHDVLAYLVTLK